MTISIVSVHSHHSGSGEQSDYSSDCGNNGCASGTAAASSAPSYVSIVTLEVEVETERRRQRQPADTLVDPVNVCLVLTVNVCETAAGSPQVLEHITLT